MATLASSTATAASDLSTLSQISAKAAEQLSTVLESTEVSFEDDIPELEHEPRLEDILNEDESSVPTLDELGISEIVGESGATATASFQQGTEEYSPGSSSTEGAILRHEVLKGIANQLSQATTHNEAGLPTALAVGKYYAIGTSHGLALVFDSKEKLKCVLSPYPKLSPEIDAGQYGAVSSLDLSSDGTRLVCGYAKGLITHWDLTNSKCLRFIDNAHPPGFGVLNIKFMDDPTTIVFNNTGGNVFMLKLKRTLGVRNWTTECFFSGCHGEALTFEPLLLENREESPLKEYSIVAVATVTQILILSISPKLEGLISLSLRGKPKCLPQLAWHYVVIEHRSAAGKTYSTVDPVWKPNSKGCGDVLLPEEIFLYLKPGPTWIANEVLAAVRGNKITYIQSSNSQKKEPQFRLLRKTEVEYDIAAFRWINPHTVVAMDTTERIHLISVKDDAEIEVLDLRHVELMYGSSFFKSIETGGNVSKALMVASEHACYSSVVSYQDQLMLLGLKAVHIVTIKPWKERLACLVRDGRLMEALQLGLDLYDGKARAVIGLSGPPKKRRETIAQQIVDILQGYLDLGVMMQKPSGGNEKELRQHYKTLVEWAFDCCLRIKKPDLLFGSIYDTFRGEDNLSKAVFLEHLCEHIKQGKLHHVRTVIAKDFFEHYSQLGAYNLLESCILQLNPACLDIHQVVEMCWSQQLYDAMIHVYNQGLHDYTTPLLELLLQLRAALKKGKILPDEYQKIGYKLLVYIRCCLAGLAYPSGNITSDMVALAKTSVYEVLLALTNMHNPSDKASYPHIRTLLEFDTREFLNVVAMAFEEQDFDAAMSSDPPPGIPTRQQVVDTLMQVMVHDKQHSFSVLEYITHAEEDVVNEERQQALLELWHAGVLKKFDEEKLLIKAESARFYRLCELIYEKKRNFAKVLSCYLRDGTRRHRSFSYIHAVMSEDHYTDPDREEVARAVLENFRLLISTDVRATARLVLMDFSLELAEVTYKLQGKPEEQFDFLQGIFDPKSTTKQEFAPPSHVVERYIELLCRYQPEAVYNFLRANDNYRVEEALEVCAKARLMDATAYLLERSGDIMGAFKLILEVLGGTLLNHEVLGKMIRQTLESEMNSVSEKYFSEEKPNRDMTSSLDKVEGILQALLQFCQRNSSRLEEKARQSMWFPTFDRVHNLQRRYDKSPNQQLANMYNFMIGEVLNSMLGYISPPDILQKIIQDPSYQFKDIKQLIMGMLETYNYEETLLKTTNHILVHDVRGSLAHLCSLVQRGVSPNSGMCVICSRSAETLADGSKDDVIIFSCGHLYHASCVGVSTHEVSTLGISCLVCNKSAPGGQSRRSHSEIGQGTGRNSSFRPKKSAPEEVQLEPAQKDNLKRVHDSYKSSPELLETIELRLAPPRLSGY